MTEQSSPAPVPLFPNRLRHPPPLDNWPLPLFSFDGPRVRLNGVRVYHDFVWSSEIPHGGHKFKNGESLTRLIRKGCPPGKRPALLLTVREDGIKSPIDADREWIVVVKVREYLNYSEADCATTFFTRGAAGPVIGISALQSLVVTPDQLDAFLGSFLDQEALERWVKTDPTRLRQLAGVASQDLSTIVSLVEEHGADSRLFDALCDQHLTYSSISRWADGDPQRIGQLRELSAALDSTNVGPGTVEHVIQMIGVLEEIDGDSFRTILMLLQRTHPEGLSNLWQSLLESDNLPTLIDIIQKLDPNTKGVVNTFIGVDRLRSSISLWKTNENNPDEEFWQITLADNAFVLSQLFCHPVVILKEKAFVGGKGVGNVGGNLVDYLLKNDLTDNALLLEIKTPTTQLLGPLYRQDVYNVHPDLCGAALQVLNYKHSLLTHYHSLRSDSPQAFSVFDPPCLVVAGHTDQLDNERKQKSFELYRNGLKDAQVITYDELFRKIEVLLKLFEESGGGQDTRPREVLAAD